MSSNPFHQFDENPFADAAVLEAAEYGEVEEPVPEPETSKKKSGKKGKDKGGEKLFTGASSSTPDSSPPPPYSDPSSEALRMKEEELRKKEADLAARQRQMEQQARQQLQQQPQMQQQQQQQQSGPKAPNWPPFRPFIYHSIPDEIPAEYQRLVTFLYRSWFFTILCLFMNMIGCLCILIAGVRGEDFGFSIMYLIVIPPLAFLLWYRPGYNAFMKDNSFYFVIFMAFNFCHILFMLYLVMGGPETGSAGFINMVSLFGKKHYGEGAVSLIALIILMMGAAVHIYLFRQVYLIYRFRGHTLQSARNQAFTSAAQSDVGRQAISTAVVGAAQGFANSAREV